MIEAVIHVSLDLGVRTSQPEKRFKASLRDFVGLHAAGDTPAKAAKNLVKKITAHVRHREDERLLFGHLPSTTAGYTIVPIFEYTTFE